MKATELRNKYEKELSQCLDERRRESDPMKLGMLTTEEILLRAFISDLKAIEKLEQ